LQRRDRPLRRHRRPLPVPSQLLLRERRRRQHIPLPPLLQRQRHPHAPARLRSLPRSRLPPFGVAPPRLRPRVAGPVRRGVRALLAADLPGGRDRRRALPRRHAGQRPPPLRLRGLLTLPRRLRRRRDVRRQVRVLLPAVGRQRLEARERAGRVRGLRVQGVLELGQEPVDAGRRGGEGDRGRVGRAEGQRHGEMCRWRGTRECHGAARRRTVRVRVGARRGRIRTGHRLLEKHMIFRFAVLPRGGRLVLAVPEAAFQGQPVGSRPGVHPQDPPERVRREAVHVRAAGGSDEEVRQREGRGHRRRHGARRRARRRLPGGGAEDRLRDAGEAEAGAGPDRAPVRDLPPQHRPRRGLLHRLQQRAAAGARAFRRRHAGGAPAPDEVPRSQLVPQGQHRHRARLRAHVPGGARDRPDLPPRPQVQRDLPGHRLHRQDRRLQAHQAGDLLLRVVRPGRRVQLRPPPDRATDGAEAADPVRLGCAEGEGGETPRGHRPNAPVGEAASGLSRRGEEGVRARRPVLVQRRERAVHARRRQGADAHSEGQQREQQQDRDLPRGDVLQLEPAADDLHVAGHPAPPSSMKVDDDRPVNIQSRSH
ncbi:putative inactive receptor-like protein kinase, partial [Dichanthelium oligosanthes]